MGDALSPKGAQMGLTLRSLQLLSAWFKLEGQRLEQGEMTIEQSENLSVNISPNVIPLHPFSQKQHF